LYATENGGDSEGRYKVYVYRPLQRVQVRVVRQHERQVGTLLYFGAAKNAHSAF